MADEDTLIKQMRADIIWRHTHHEGTWVVLHPGQTLYHQRLGILVTPKPAHGCDLCALFQAHAYCDGIEFDHNCGAVEVE